jgi:hypothetical protein
MKKVAALAIVFLLGAAVAAYAQKSPGASEYTPGDTMKDRSMQGGPKGQGAFRYAPGHEQRTPGGASELSPGDRMNDKRGR